MNQKRKCGAIYCTIIAILLSGMIVFSGCTGEEKAAEEDLKKSEESGQIPEGKSKDTEEQVVDGNTDKPQSYEGLSAETEERILMDFFAIHHGTLFDDYYIEDEKEDEDGEIVLIVYEKKYTTNDLALVYHGTYNGYVAVLINGPWFYPDVVKNFLIAGVIIHGPQTPEVWKDGEFYSLQEAYNLGFLSDGDIRSIASTHNPGDFNSIHNPDLFEGE